MAAFRLQEGQRQLFAAQQQAPDSGLQLALQSQAYPQQWSMCTAISTI